MYLFILFIKCFIVTYVLYILYFLQHLDLWFDLMWCFRPADADWTLTGTQFLRNILDGKMFPHFSDGTYYPVAWRNVEKVSIQLSYSKYNSNEMYIRSFTLVLI